MHQQEHAMNQFRDKVKGFGWRPDQPSPKDWKFGQIAGVARTYSPESRDRRDVNPPVRDQGNLGSCVGFSITAAVGYLRRTDRDHLSTNYSALQMYYDARVRDGMNWKEVDAGAYIRDGVDSLRHVGVAPESRWPYRTERFAITPPARVYKE